MFNKKKISLHSHPLVSVDPVSGYIFVCFRDYIRGFNDKYESIGQVDYASSGLKSYQESGPLPSLLSMCVFDSKFYFVTATTHNIIILDKGTTHIRNMNASCLTVTRNYIIVGTEYQSILLLDHTWKTIKQFGCHGKENAQFQTCNAICVNSLGQIIVCDQESRRISVFDLDGNWLKNVDFHKKGYFIYRPFNICTDPENNLLIIDRKIQAVFILSPDGKLLDEIHFANKCVVLNDILIWRNKIIVTHEGGILWL